ncbi:hypothetical protein PICSAR26_04483 [Mycobacterium avium subsp. paratuberculosis]|nr:hypothetical protein PICSAR26_04483 [Mycobacterium avium subsp. paratuberculosis]
MHEGQRHELGETAGAVLDVAQHVEVAHPVPGVVAVAVHHGRARPQPHFVCGGDDLDPQRGRQLALGQHPAHLVVEDLGRGAGDGVQPGLAQADQPLPDRQPALGHPVGDLHRRERVHVHRRHPRLDRADQIGVAGDRQFGVDAALHAHLGGAGDVRLPGAVGDLLGRQRVRVGVALALREGAEPATGVADVGEVDVAVHHERHVVADGVAAQRIRKGSNGFQRRTVGGGQRQVFAVGAAGRVAFGGAQRGEHVAVQAFRRSGALRGQLVHVRADRLPVAEGAVDVAAGLAVAALRVDRRVEVDAARGTDVVGFLPRQPHRIDVAGQTGHRIGQRPDMPGHPRVDPGRTRLHVFGLRGQPLDQLVAGFGSDGGQFVQRRPRPLGVDMVGRQR